MLNYSKCIGLGVSNDSELYKQLQQQGGQAFIFDVGVSWEDKDKNNLITGDK